MDKLDQARQILSKALFMPEDEIKPDDKLLELKGMDSLAFETIVLEIEDTTGKDVDVGQATSIETVADLSALLAKLSG